MEQSQIKNFVIIAHIDHGKSTLADRFLELTGTVEKRKMREQFLDMMDLEREKGITIKMQPVRMSYTLNAIPYILNLIDTPGHVDFSYEVSRSLAAVEGAILLVDATKGIQAQTLANLDLARKQNLVIIPAVNKIDRLEAKIQETQQELAYLLNIPREEIFLVSGKMGTNVEQLLKAVIEKVPSSKGDSQKPLRALVFDSKYDSYKGVIAYVRIFDGEIKAGEKIYLMAAKTKGEVKEVGFFKPELTSKDKLAAGEIGYIATGIKNPGEVKVGETITKISNSQLSTPNIEPLPGYKEPKPVVFTSLYPENPDDFSLLSEGLERLKLNDASLTYETESREALGRGFRCGFLGLLHTEIVIERLRREFGLNLIVSKPQVLYKIIEKSGKEKLIYSVSDWPDPSQIQEIQEPLARLEIITPINYLGRVLEVLKNLRARHLETKYFGQDKQMLIYEIPLREIIVDFYENLKNATAGFGSMNYEILGYRNSDLVKIDVLVAGQKQEPFSKIVPREKLFEEAKKIVLKLKEVLPPQLFSVALQAAVSGKIIARETIRARAKDVIAPLYGGDYTRKRKLLEKQKKGKKEMKEKGKINIPPKVFIEMLRS
jgi:GTP-binding protein LepA